MHTYILIYIYTTMYVQMHTDTQMYPDRESKKNKLSIAQRPFTIGFLSSSNDGHSSYLGCGCEKDAKHPKCAKHFSKAFFQSSDAAKDVEHVHSCCNRSSLSTMFTTTKNVDLVFTGVEVLQ